MTTADGKTVLFDVGTGEQRAFWPVDAKALLAAGSHSMEPPKGAKVIVPVMPPATVGVPVAATPVLPPSGQPRAKRQAKADLSET